MPTYKAAGELDLISHGCHFWHPWPLWRGAEGRPTDSYMGWLQWLHCEASPRGRSQGLKLASWASMGCRPLSRPGVESRGRIRTLVFIVQGGQDLYPTLGSIHPRT